MFIGLHYSNCCRLSARAYVTIYGISAVAMALVLAHLVLACFDTFEPNTFPPLVWTCYHAIYTLENALVFGIYWRVKVLKRRSSLRIRTAFGLRSHLCDELVWALTVLFVLHTLLFSVLQCALQLQPPLCPTTSGDPFCVLDARNESHVRAFGHTIDGVARDPLALLLSADFFMPHETLGPIAFFFSSRCFRQSWTALFTRSSACCSPCSSSDRTHNRRADSTSAH